MIQGNDNTWLTELCFRVMITAGVLNLAPVVFTVYVCIMRSRPLDSALQGEAKTIIHNEEHLQIYDSGMCLYSVHTSVRICALRKLQG